MQWTDGFSREKENVSGGGGGGGGGGVMEMRLQVSADHCLGSMIYLWPPYM